MAESNHSQMSGPPYTPMTAGVGGLPNVGLDVPVTSVFLALYIAFAATNMTILQVNMKRNHKFLISGALFGFCMARIATCVLRLAWATHQHNSRLAIAANIFVNAGILIVYVVNIIFAQRILRAKNPRLGWNPILRSIFKVFYALIGVALACVITSVILSSYTLNTHIREQCRDIQLAAITYLLAFTTLPWFLLALAFFTQQTKVVDHFGHGSVNRKALIVLASSSLCVIIAGFKAGTLWMPPRPASNPAWYHSKACFYVFNFGLEIVILSLLVSTRIDKVFHVPNGSKGPGDYTSLRVDSKAQSVHEGEEIEKA